MKSWLLLFLLFGFFAPLAAQEPIEIPLAEPTATLLPTPVPTPEPEPEPEPEPVKAPDGVSVTVLGDRVNLRNRPELDSDVVGQANYGDVYPAVSLTDEWVEIALPASVAVWVYSPLLFEDREVRAPEMNVRSGPGTQFFQLGQLTRGTPVTVVESLGEWRRIETPESLTVWISRDFVQLPPAMEEPVAPAPTPTPVPVPTPITIVEVRTVERIVEVPVPVPVIPTPEPEVQAPAGLDLVPLRGQGTVSRRRGIVKAYLLRAGSPSRFTLQREDGTLLCYLIGNQEELNAASGSMMMIRGRDYWVTGQKLPVTQVEEMKPGTGEGTP